MSPRAVRIPVSVTTPVARPRVNTVPRARGSKVIVLRRSLQNRWSCLRNRLSGEHRLVDLKPLSLGQVGVCRHDVTGLDEHHVA